jgi:hypothetical protein
MTVTYTQNHEKWKIKYILLMLWDGLLVLSSSALDGAERLSCDIRNKLPIFAEQHCTRVIA